MPHSNACAESGYWAALTLQLLTFDWTSCPRRAWMGRDGPLRPPCPLPVSPALFRACGGGSAGMAL